MMPLALLDEHADEIHCGLVRLGSGVHEHRIGLVEREGIDPVGHPALTLEVRRCAGDELGFGVVARVGKVRVI